MIQITKVKQQVIIQILSCCLNFCHLDAEISKNEIEINSVE